MIDHNELFRFGSAAWSDAASLHRAGLFAGRGLPIGFWQDAPLSLESDSPLITIGGAGSGKLRDMLAYVVCGSPDRRMFVLDPRGELAAISLHNFARVGAPAWCWNPTGLHGAFGLPRHRCNPLDLLTRGSPTLSADTKFIAHNLIALGKGDSDSGQYFEQRGRGIVECLLRFHVEFTGQVSFRDLYRLINVIESDPPAWARTLERMLACQCDVVRRTAAEMLTKQQESPREFGSIMGTIYANLGWLDDPLLLEALDNPDFSLAQLCDEDHPGTVFLNVPMEYIELWAPLLRVMFTTTMLYKQRKPSGPRVHMIVDEAGQMGKFEMLLRALTFGRGAGVRPWAFFQDVGQIERTFGRAGLQSFLGSAQLRQFFGVRDYATARMISDMLGHETLSYRHDRQALVDHHQQRAALHRILGSDDPIGAVIDYKHHEALSAVRPVQSRLLMTPDEILALPDDRQIIFLSGKNVKPILAHKYPYFEHPAMAGRYLPNPYHPPCDRVPIATRHGTHWARVVCEPVPPEFAALPQYDAGQWRYVEGYRPHLRQGTKPWTIRKLLMAPVRLLAPPQETL